MDEPVSSFAFNFILRRCSTGGGLGGGGGGGGGFDADALRDELHALMLPGQQLQLSVQRLSVTAGAYTRSDFSSASALLSTALSNLTHECLLEMLKLSSNVNECKPLRDGRPGAGGRGLHSYTFQLNLTRF